MTAILPGLNMLDREERQYVHQRACIPEQVPEYVAAVSGAEPFLWDDYLCYLAGEMLIFVGYPLEGPLEAEKLREQVQAARARFRAASLTLIAPQVPLGFRPLGSGGPDHYFRLDLEKCAVQGKLLSTLNRAARELRVEEGQELRDEHLRCVAEFLDSRKFGEATRGIFTKIPVYAAVVSTSRVFTARDGAGRLAAFTVAEFGARDYAFYMFNFRSPGNQAPGASDLLLNELVSKARAWGKRYVNLGLGINEGVTFFKKKWGGYPFLPYVHCQSPGSKTSMFKSLLRHLN